jgi:hypothetical protein
MVAPQQTAASGPFGIADATARTLVNGIARDPRLSSTHAFVAGMRHAYERLSPAARPPAVANAFAWIKAYVGSSAFSTVYTAARQQAKPAGLPPEELTVDAELKNKIDDKRKELEETRQQAAALPATDRSQLLAFVKQIEDEFADPATIKLMRDEIENRRLQDARAVAEVSERWNDTYPPTVRDFVRRGLERFLEAATRVDLTVPITPFKSPAGIIVGFVAPIDHLLESWIDIECMLAGRDMVLAARAAAQAWLKELSA